MIRNGPSINSWHGVDWIHLVRDWYRWQALVSMVVIFVPQWNEASENVLTSEEGPSFVLYLAFVVGDLIGVHRVLWMWRYPCMILLPCTSITRCHELDFWVRFRARAGIVSSKLFWRHPGALGVTGDYFSNNKKRLDRETDCFPPTSTRFKNARSCSSVYTSVFLVWWWHTGMSFHFHCQ